MLCHASLPLAAAFNIEWKEGQTNEYALPTTTVAAFKLAVYCIFFPDVLVHLTEFDKKSFATVEQFINYDGRH